MTNFEKEKNIAIKVTDLSLGFVARGKKIHVLRDISLDIIEGETLAIVGESGSGKSVFTKAFTGMLDANGFINSGSIIFHGQDLVKFTKNKQWIEIRGRKIATIFQDPMTSLNPLFSIGYQISEVLKLHSKPTDEQMKEFKIRKKENKHLEKQKLQQMNVEIRKEKNNRLEKQKLQQMNVEIRKEKNNRLEKQKLQQMTVDEKKDYLLKRKAEIKRLVDVKKRYLLKRKADIRRLVDVKKQYHLKKKEDKKQLFDTLFAKALLDLSKKDQSNPIKRLELKAEVRRETRDAWIGKPRAMSNHEAKKETLNLLRKVQIPNAEDRYNDYPFQYSGGMRQRVVIAIALACHPEVLICDEPTTALDVTVQSQIIKLIKDLQKDYKWTTIFITHDLGVVANVADRIAVMYGGQIVEYGTAEDIFYRPAHPYTWALLSSLPQLGSKDEPLSFIPGNPPSFSTEIIGDPFAERNHYALSIDFLANPPMFKISETHSAKTWLLDSRAPQVEKPKVIVELRTRMKRASDELIKHQKGGRTGD